MQRLNNVQDIYSIRVLSFVNYSYFLIICGSTCQTSGCRLVAEIQDSSMQLLITLKAPVNTEQHRLTVFVVICVVLSSDTNDWHTCVDKGLKKFSPCSSRSLCSEFIQECGFLWINYTLGFLITSAVATVGNIQDLNSASHHLCVFFV